MQLPRTEEEFTLYRLTHGKFDCKAEGVPTRQWIEYLMENMPHKITVKHLSPVRWVIWVDESYVGVLGPYHANEDKVPLCQKLNQFYREHHSE